MRQGVITLHLRGKNQGQLHEITPPSSGWKSPVPYLFGGLAAVLGLIAVALLILACSAYCKLSSYQDNSSDPTSNEKHKDASHATTTIAYMNSILVIMAGDEKPTFLATPATSKASSFGDTDSSKASTSSGGSCDGGEDKEVKEVLVVTIDNDEKQ